MNKVKKNYPKRKAHNWLEYDIVKKYLNDYSKLYKGTLINFGRERYFSKEKFLNYVNKYIRVDKGDNFSNSKIDLMTNLNKTIPLENNFADTIFALNILEHVKEPQHFLDESFRILRNDSYLILYVPFQSGINNLSSDYFRYTPYGLEYLLKKSGYQNIKVQPTAGFFTTIFLKLNYFSLRLTKGSKFKKRYMSYLLRPFWYINQKLATVLDKTHRGWSLEAQSFFVVAYKGGKYKDRFCPICNKYSKEFLSFGYIKRENASCPNCKSLERDRLVWLYISKKTNFFNNKNQKMFHVAPEPLLQEIFQNYLEENYLSVDLVNKKAIINLDITDIPYENECFDYIFCSHVLEHIEDDKKAMSELYRILSIQGWAILNVPIVTKGKTEEDFNITSKKDRMKYYGHPDHVRNYGIDYKDRLESVGFKVKVIQSNDFLTKEEIINMSITSASGEIYFCTK